MGVLADHGDPDRARPVVVEVGQLVGQGLDVLHLQTGVVIINNVVGGRVHRPLPHGLRHKVEVVSGNK